MKTIFKKIQAIGVGLLLGMCASLPAMADDIEIYTDVSLGASDVNPNVMFILDSSASMLVTSTPTESYDYSKTYDGDTANACVFDVNMVYYSFDGSIPACGTRDYFNLTALMCDNATTKYMLNDSGDLVVSQTDGVDDIGAFIEYGSYTDKWAQFTGSSRYKWLEVATPNAASRALWVECKQDSGVHGSAAGVYYIADSSTGWENTPVTGDAENPHGVWYDSSTSGTIYHGNYLNYLVEPGLEVVTTPVSLFDQVKEVIIAATGTQSAINIGLMQYDTSTYALGGSVQYPITDVLASRGDFEPRVNTMNAGGSSTISETYYEALKYFGGRDVDFASSPHVNPSNIGSSMESGNDQYTTPITSTCQKNYIIVLSDGIPDKDYIDASRRTTTQLPGFTPGSCNLADDDELDWNKNPGVADATDDNCLDELSEWAANNDVAYQSIDAHDGVQNITTYTVGFNFPSDLAAGSPMSNARTLLEETASKGGGQYYEAGSAEELAAKIAEIFAGILDVNSTFSSPAVSVNAFNRATNLDDLFFTLFKPAELATGVSGAHWEGNLKKFKLEFDANNIPFVADMNGAEAVDAATGFFVGTSQSYWSATADGSETSEGGAASHLTVPTARKVYTFAGSYTAASGVLTPSDTDLTSSGNALLSNTAVTDTMLDIVDYAPLAALPDDPYRDSLLNWAAGIDVYDDDQDGSTTDARQVMGDPLHAEPALVQYGGTVDEPDLVAYVATNDGYLHAINTSTGDEYFAFIPQEMLPKLQNIFDDTGVNSKAYGLDGNVVSWINDVNSDGDLLDTSDGDHVYLYFGMRRGGRYIYSMDVTDRNTPKLRWVIEGGAGNYAELGQTWSAPNVEKIKTGTGTDDYKVVLIFGAGYDTAQDVSTATRDSGTGDSVGRGIFIVDADTGALLWRAGPDGTANLQLTDMKYSIPARIKPIDINGDGYVDRLYAGDLGGQLWRIDIGLDESDALSITGGRIADLAADGSLSDYRRFYNPPDAAVIIESGQAPYIAIVAASGYRAHPLQTDNHDRVYMIRDTDVYNAPADGTYITVTEDDLFDTTDNLIGEGTTAEITTATDLLNDADNKGWYITLNEMDGSYVGEKALSESLILNGVAIFTTYIPASAGLTSNSCTANDGTGAIYYVNIADGTPTDDRNDDEANTREDRRVFLARGGIPPTPRIIITEDGIPTLCVGTECSKSGDVGTVQKMYWYEVE